MIFESYSICKKMNIVTPRLEQQLDKFSLMVLNSLTPLRKVKKLPIALLFNVFRIGDLQPRTIFLQMQTYFIGS